ncbi:OmpH family outer membrane protein [Sneathiella chinensis]|uniref:Outer membrane chaperone Skp n=1 Tax=Sneathiella chinensis TaxID=349750 RepID=A0ABQ5U690_9PROT|nr:OmpH family outer membrane protein [Sneathiella chinensis]GLQ07205.1 hypothetical protein GCM10007924_24260 [Sneathiella chinensis]
MHKFVKKAVRFLSVLGLSAFLVGQGGQAAFAKDIILFLDLGKILSESAAMKDIGAQVKAMEEKLRTDTVAQEQVLRQEQDELSRQKVVLPPESFRQKQEAFNQKARKAALDVQLKRQQLAQSRAAAIAKVEGEMAPIVLEIAKSMGAALVIEKKDLIFAEKTLEITDQIIDRLNAKVTKVKVTLVPIKK